MTQAPTIRLVYGSPEVMRASFADPLHPPSLLVSYVVLSSFLRERATFHYRDWVLDSGAFTAHNSGNPITLSDYVTTCQQLASDPNPPTEFYSLDVIGDWRASERNTQALWRAGVQAIPTFHLGEPWDVLKGLARDYPKIALGGIVPVHKKKSMVMTWIGECFGRVYPKKIHGFGMGRAAFLEQFPFHSVDASTWFAGPNRFGYWYAFGERLGLKAALNVRAEVDRYLRLERIARTRWRHEMRRLK